MQREGFQREPTENQLYKFGIIKHIGLCFVQLLDGRRCRPNSWVGEGRGRPAPTNGEVLRGGSVCIFMLACRASSVVQMPTTNAGSGPKTAPPRLVYLSYSSERDIIDAGHAKATLGIDFIHLAHAHLAAFHTSVENCADTVPDQHLHNAVPVLFRWAVPVADRSSDQEWCLLT